MVEKELRVKKTVAKMRASTTFIIGLSKKYGSSFL